MSAAGESPGLVTCGCQTCPCCATKIGTLLALAGLWLLLAVPPADVVGEHHPSHFWLVFAAAALSAWLAPTVGGAARHHGDARLLLVGLGFLAAVLLCGLHALATPGVLLDHAKGGSPSRRPSGSPSRRPRRVGGVRGGGRVERGRSPRGMCRAGGLVPAVGARRAGRGVGCGVADRAAPARRPRRGRTCERRGRAARVIAVPLYLAAAVRCFLLYRRRHSVVLLSIPTADVLLAEAMVAVALGANWHLTWWLWHVLMVSAFGYVGSMLTRILDSDDPVAVRHRHCRCS